MRDPGRARELSAEGGEAPFEVLPLDYLAPGTVAALAAGLESRGGIDLLVHNAGFGVFGPFEEVGDEAVARQFAANLLGPLRLTRLLLPGLRARGGMVVWIGSLAGRLALPFQAHYCATKAAVASVSDAMRMELAPLGVRVTCVEPGDFATGFTDARERHLAGDSPYRARAEACLQAVEQQERGGPEAEQVAEAVQALSRKRRPPARRPVGQWARTLCWVHRVLPDRLREFLVTRTYRQ